MESYPGNINPLLVSYTNPYLPTSNSLDSSLLALMRTHSKYSYEHLITGSKRQVIPDNNLGGIISDEMGMGKSLTMLSAIVGSHAAAESFAQSGRRDLVSKGVRKPASKATLVVVPSTCK